MARSGEVGKAGIDYEPPEAPRSGEVGKAGIDYEPPEAPDIETPATAPTGESGESGESVGDTPALTGDTPALTGDTPAPKKNPINVIGDGIDEWMRKVFTNGPTSTAGQDDTIDVSDEKKARIEAEEAKRNPGTAGTTTTTPEEKKPAATSAELTKVPDMKMPGINVDAITTRTTPNPAAGTALGIPEMNMMAPTVAGPNTVTAQTPVINPGAALTKSGTAAPSTATQTAQSDAAISAQQASKEAARAAQTSGLLQGQAALAGARTVGDNYAKTYSATIGANRDREQTAATAAASDATSREQIAAGREATSAQAEISKATIALNEKLGLAANATEQDRIAAGRESVSAQNEINKATIALNEKLGLAQNATEQDRIAAANAQANQNAQIEQARIQAGMTTAQWTEETKRQANAITEKLGIEANSNQAKSIEAAIAAGNMDLLGKIIGAIGGAAALLSDKNAKDNIKPVSMSDSLSKIKAYAYQYKGNDRPEAGVMAQDLEKGAMAPAVMDTPQGKMIDTRRLSTMNTAALSEHEQRLKNIESMLEALTGLED